MPSSGIRQCVVCRVGGRLCAFPVEHILETMRPLPVEPLEGLPPFIQGLSMIRGNPAVVVDTAMLLGEGLALPNRFLAMKSGSRFVAMAVSEVVSILNIEAGSFAKLPPLTGNSAFGVEALGSFDGELLYLVNGARSVPDDLWPELEAAIAKR